MAARFFVPFPVRGVEIIEIDESKIGLLKTDSDDEIGALIAAGITQKILRTQADGIDRIVGLFRCDFEPSQSRFVLNIPIHPPLNEAPDVEAIAIDGTARTRITDREKFGVRMEVVANGNEAEAAVVFLEVIISSAIKIDENKD